MLNVDQPDIIKQLRGIKVYTLKSYKDLVAPKPPILFRILSWFLPAHSFTYYSYSREIHFTYKKFFKRVLVIDYDSEIKEIIGFSEGNDLIN
jgi:hypothetical protein